MTQDYMVLVVGHPAYAILRLLLIAMIAIHLFACLFYRIKKESAASQEEVVVFYKAFNVDSTV
jgi:hypothetical protein